jgi:hypothetical protein
VPLPGLATVATRPRTWPYMARTAGACKGDPHGDVRLHRKVRRLPQRQPRQRARRVLRLQAHLPIWLARGSHCRTRRPSLAHEPPVTPTIQRGFAPRMRSPTRNRYYVRYDLTDGLIAG